MTRTHGLTGRQGSGRASAVRVLLVGGKMGLTCSKRPNAEKREDAVQKPADVNADVDSEPTERKASITGKWSCVFRPTARKRSWVHVMVLGGSGPAEEIIGLFCGRTSFVYIHLLELQSAYIHGTHTHVNILQNNS